MEPLSVQLATKKEEYDLTSPMGRWMVTHGYFWGLFAFPLQGEVDEDGVQQYGSSYERLSRN